MDAVCGTLGEGAGGSLGFIYIKKGQKMSEMVLIYIFIGLMAFNILASFLYLIGLDNLRTSINRAYQNYMKSS